MNPSSLPPQGRYQDPRIQQMVNEELKSKEIDPEKFYFTSDDWMVSYDGPTPAWNSVFGIAPYRKDDETFYAEVGVSQRYDANTSQWSEPAATVREGLPLSQADYDAVAGGPAGSGGDADAAGPDSASAPEQSDGASMSGAAQPGGFDSQPGMQQDAHGGGQPGFGAPDSAQTVIAPAAPGVGEAVQTGEGIRAGGVGDGPGGFGQADRRDEQSEQTDQTADSGLAGFVPSDSAAAQAKTGSMGDTDDDVRAAELATHPVDNQSMGGVDVDTAHGSDGVPDAGGSAGTDGGAADLSGAADLGASSGPGGVSETGAGSATGWGSSSSATGPRHAHADDFLDDSRGDEQEAPSYEAAGAEDAARDAEEPQRNADDAASSEGLGEPTGTVVGGGSDEVDASYDKASDDRETNIAGYSLTVKEDGTAELRVPRGGQVTLKWDGQ